MKFDEKETLAMTGDTSQTAQGIRLRAALKAFGYKQKEFAERLGVLPSVINNALNGRNETSKNAMLYLYKEHEVDFNFMMIGAYNRMPAETQDKLFAALISTNKRLEQKSDSD